MYNTQRPPLIIAEYGRNVQNMVAHALSIEDKEHRNKVAHSIIDVMGNLNPHLRDVPDFKHKLWDHLFIMSEFKLDVDSPYPKPSEESFDEKPAKVEYPDQGIRYKHYGRTIAGMIKKAVEMEDGEYKTGLSIALANHMKKCYLIWNKGTVDDDTIWKHVEQYSDGAIKKPEGVELTSTATIMKNNQIQSNNSNHKKRSNNKGKGRKKNYSNNR